MMRATLCVDNIQELEREATRRFGALRPMRAVQCALEYLSSSWEGHTKHKLRVAADRDLRKAFSIAIKYPQVQGR